VDQEAGAMVMKSNFGRVSKGDVQWGGAGVIILMLVKLVKGRPSKDSALIQHSTASSTQP